MSHDKIKAAARKRMAETGEPYATARREVIKEHKAARGRQGPVPGMRRFALSYDAPRADTFLGIGPGASGVEVDAEEIRVRMGWGFRLDIPRSSVRSATRSRARLRGTRGVHGRAGRFVVNGSAGGLVELAIEPPCFLERRLSTLFRREKVSSLTLSLADPDGFQVSDVPVRPWRLRKRGWMPENTWIQRLAASQAVCPLPSGPVHKFVYEAWLVTPGWAVPDSA